jgi:hypothetical protein
MGAGTPVALISVLAQTCAYFCSLKQAIGSDLLQGSSAPGIPIALKITPQNG